MNTQSGDVLMKLGPGSTNKAQFDDLFDPPLVTPPGALCRLPSTYPNGPLCRLEYEETIPDSSIASENIVPQISIGHERIAWRVAKYYSGNEQHAV